MRDKIFFISRCFCGLLLGFLGFYFIGGWAVIKTLFIVLLVVGGFSFTIIEIIKRST